MLFYTLNMRRITSGENFQKNKTYKTQTKWPLFLLWCHFTLSTYWNITSIILWDNRKLSKKQNIENLKLPDLTSNPSICWPKAQWSLCYVLSKMEKCWPIYPLTQSSLISLLCLEQELHWKNREELHFSLNSSHHQESSKFEREREFWVLLCEKEE